MPPANNDQLPLRIPTGDEFERVRAFLTKAGYSEAAVLATLKVESMSEVRQVRWDESILARVSPALRVCLDVFLRGESFPVPELRQTCGQDFLDACGALGLLRPAKNAPERMVCPVWLYPLDRFWVASDRPSDPDGQQFVPAEDIVFPAIYAGTLRFLKLLPNANNEDALDLCGGSGIGALWLSRTAAQAFTSDITERSAQYAAFNARLNGANVTSLCGDVYGPVAGRLFGVITAHPPFVPAIGPTLVYRDGGECGEDVTRRVIEGLPEFLKPGGTCVVLCVGRDTTEKPFEQRILDWLGPAANGFDVLFGLEKILTMQEVVESMRKGGRNFAQAQAEELTSRLRASRTRQFVYGALYLRRTAGWHPPPPLRLNLSTEGRAVDFERVLEWRRRRSLAGFQEFLALSRPRLPAALVLTARHVVREGQLVPAEFLFSVQTGLESALRPDPWIVPILARFQGRLSVRQLFDKAASADEFPAGFRFQQFAELVSMMLEHGLLELEGGQE